MTYWQELQRDKKEIDYLKTENTTIAKRLTVLWEKKVKVKKEIRKNKKFIDTNMSLNN